MRLYGLAVMHVRNTGPLGSSVHSRRSDYSPILGEVVVVYATPRFLSRAYTESHVARRLAELGESYVWMLQRPGIEATASEWLRARHAETAELRGTLSPWTRIRAALKFVAGPAIALAVAYVGGKNLVDSLVHGDRAKLTVAVTIGVLAAVYVGPLLAGAFNYKRALFLRGPDSLVDDDVGADPAWDVYSAEDRLWTLLGLTKRRELPVDILVVACIALAISGGSLIDAEGTVIVAVLLAIMLAIVITTVRVWRVRTPR